MLEFNSSSLPQQRLPLNGKWSLALDPANVGREQDVSRLIGRHALEYVRSLDPSRPAIDNSGGAGAIDQGGAWADSTGVLPVEAAAPRALNDLHLYFASPVAPEIARWLNRIGGTCRLSGITRQGYGSAAILRSLRPRLRQDGRIFVSELGCGGLPDLEAVVAEYDGQAVDGEKALVAAFTRASEHAIFS